MADSPNSLEALIAALPMRYQPIFGVASDVEPMRPCVDRVACIAESLRDAPGTRLLDIGCAQGFFSLSLLSKGVVASTLGIEVMPANVALTNALAEHHRLNARFQRGHVSVRSIADLLADQTFDAVLLLSVLHHIEMEEGLQATQHLLALLAERVGLVFMELALVADPLSPTSLEPYQKLLAPFAHYKLLGWHVAHLKNAVRPLVVASRDPIDGLRSAPTRLAPRPTCYLFTPIPPARSPSADKLGGWLRARPMTFVRDHKMVIACDVLAQPIPNTLDDLAVVDFRQVVATPNDVCLYFLADHPLHAFCANAYAQHRTGQVITEYLK